MGANAPFPLLWVLNAIGHSKGKGTDVPIRHVEPFKSSSHFKKHHTRSDFTDPPVGITQKLFHR